MMSKNLLVVLVGLFILYDTFRTFDQHRNLPLDGDMANIILPGDVYKQAMLDPFAFKVLFQGKKYHAPNRAFAHWSMSLYYKTVPFLFQIFTSPINSVYLASALAKTIFQCLVCYMIALFVSVGRSRRIELLFCIAILLPLFQTVGFNKQIGIVDQAPTYSFFYAFPMGVLLLFYFPFYRAFVLRQQLKFTFPMHCLWSILMIFLAFSCPLIPAIAIILTTLIFAGSFYYRGTNAATNFPCKTSWGYFAVFFVLAVYSLYVGTFNLENFANIVPLRERYVQLFIGLEEVFIKDLAFPLILSLIVINLIFLVGTGLQQELKSFIFLMCLFSLLYIVLLPLGGYRSYRPNILRNDTVLPVIIFVFYLVALTTIRVLDKQVKLKIPYAFVLLAILLFFHFADSHASGRNKSEKKAILAIANSPNRTVVIHDYCTILGWRPIKDSTASALNARMLRYWGIIDRDKLYYQVY